MSDQAVGRIEQLTHTKGPWEPGPLDGVGPVEVYTPGHHRIASILATGLAATDQSKANARLIAASPDLLAVAIEAENWFDNHGAEDDEGAQMLLSMFRAAIAKAKGTSA